MNEIYHILNGDALNAQFSEEIVGERIVFRECLMEGPVRANDLSSLYQIRAKFLETYYPIEGHPSYQAFVVSQFDNVLRIPEGSQVNLWFEDDLFCQVNLWFCAHLLKGAKVSIYLVRPTDLSPYGFAAYSQKELLQLLDKRVSIKSIEEWSRLWDAFQANDRIALVSRAQSMDAFPFVKEAVRAHMDRFPEDQPWGRPEQSLIQIMKDLNTRSFGPVFQEFTQREAIYGFGDLQVRRLFDRVIANENNNNYE